MSSDSGMKGRDGGWRSVDRARSDSQDDHAVMTFAARLQRLMMVPCEDRSR